MRGGLEVYLRRLEKYIAILINISLGLSEWEGGVYALLALAERKDLSMWLFEKRIWLVMMEGE